MIRLSIAVALLVAGCSGNGGGDVADGGAGGDGPGDAPADLAGGGTDLASTDFAPAAHAPFPSVTSNDDFVLSPMRLVTIVAQNDTFHDQLIAFGQMLPSSQWWQAVGADYMLGKAATPVVATGPAITANLTFTTLESYVKALITKGDVPAADGTTVYMVYLPDGVSLNDPNTTDNQDCAQYEGYHEPFGNLGDNLAFAQRCIPSNMPGSLDDATNTGSHEIIESATDPSDGYALPATPDTMAWTSSVWSIIGYGGPAEVADLCIGTDWVEGGFQYQRVWSNTAAKAGGDPCVPALGQPYYNVSAPKDWFATDGKGRADIPLTGWSTAPTGDWGLDYELVDPTLKGWTVTFQNTRTVMANGVAYPAIHNGETVTVSVTAPAGAPSGSFQGVIIYSFPTSGGGDDYHVWPIGAYVP